VKGVSDIILTMLAHVSVEQCHTHGGPGSLVPADNFTAVHTAMCILYTNATCSQCGRFSVLILLYVCGSFQESDIL
jgi:hypothetical protein